MTYGERVRDMDNKQLAQLFTHIWASGVFGVHRFSEAVMNTAKKKMEDMFFRVLGQECGGGADNEE